MEEFGAGEVVGGCVDVYDNVRKLVEIPFERIKINALSGRRPEEKCKAYFRKEDLDCDASAVGIALTFRQDLKRTADLRRSGALYGYERIPSTLPSGARQRLGNCSLICAYWRQQDVMEIASSPRATAIPLDQRKF